MSMPDAAAFIAFLRDGPRGTRHPWVNHATDYTPSTTRF